MCFLYRIDNNERSDADDYPDEMVEIVFPFDTKNKTFVNPRLGKKIPRVRKKLALIHRPNQVLFRPNVQSHDIASGHVSKDRLPKFNANIIKSPEKNRMYNFTRFEHGKKSEHNKSMPKATPHLSEMETMRYDDKEDSNKTVDEDLKILFKNLDPVNKDNNRSYLINNSKIMLRKRTKRGVEGGSGAAYRPADYDKYCGGTFRGLSGVIKSPGYPLYYPNRKHCVYDIEVPDGKDYTIKFTCDDFGVQGTQVISLTFL